MRCKRIPFLIGTILFSSAAAFSQAPAEGHDLATELKKAWPEQVDYDQHVWQLFPLAFSELDVYEGHNLYDSHSFVLKCELVGRDEDFTLGEKGNPIRFDSTFYRDNVDPSLALVKGLVFPLDCKNRPKNIYLGILFDDRVRTSPFTSNKKDPSGQPYYEISQTGFENSADPMGEYDYDFGVPIYLTYKVGNGTNSQVISPKRIVRVFEIAHSIGNLLSDHPGVTLNHVPLDRLVNSSTAEKFTKEFAKDHLQNFTVTFEFSDKTSEGYYCAKLPSGVFVLFSGDFIQTRYGRTGSDKNTTTPSHQAVRMTSSPVIKAERDADYKVENLSDDDLTTAWCPADKTGGWVSWEFGEPATFSKILIANGYQRVSAKGTDLFKANARVAKIRLTNDRGERTELTLDDANTPGWYNLENSGIAKSINSLKLEILSVYPGSKYADVLLSEVKFE